MLPTDLVGIVASFLSREDLNLKDVTIQQCQEVKALMMDTMRFECGDGDDNTDRGCASVDVAPFGNPYLRENSTSNVEASSREQVLLPASCRSQDN